MDQAEEPFTSPHDPGLLAAYVEGRLDAGERRAMTVHLGACADCRQALAMLARAPGVLPLAAKPRLVARPVWLALAATVLLATYAVRRLDGPIATGVEPGPSPMGGVASSVATPPPSHPATAEPSPGSSVPANGPMLDPGLLVKRGLRQAGGRSFRLLAGEWVDTGFDSKASLPTVLIKGPAERAAAVQRQPALGPYAALGDRVVVVFEGTVYRFAP
jgi:putative zinc finger protein